MMFLLLFCSVSGMLLSEVCAMDNILNHNNGVYGGDDVNPGSVDIMRNLIKEEFDKRWSHIVSHLQDKLIVQERRIKHLEKRDKRRQIVVDRLALEVLELENMHDTAQFVRNQGGEKENVNSDHMNVQKVVDTRQTDTDYKKSNVRHRIKSGINKRNEMEMETLPRIFPRRGISTGHMAFSAYIDHVVYPIDIGDKIIMNRVLLNDGNGYNAHTGVFTAPTSGVYMFNYHIAVYSHATHVRLVMDGTEEVDAIVFQVDGHEHMSGNTAVLRVAAGQSVWLEEVSYQGGLLYSAPTYRYCTFSGVLLY